MSEITRIGTCPICQKRVERSYTDIFFPYCGYACKRVVQREQEAVVKAKILKQQKWYEEQYERDRERREREKMKMDRKLTIEKIQLRIAQCQSEYQKYHKEADRLPKGCKKRWRANEYARNWYKKMVKAQVELNQLQKGEELNDSGRQTDSYLN